VFYAASLPAEIEFDSVPFTDVQMRQLTFTWLQPVIDDTTMLPVDSYKVYWDAGYILEGDFVFLAEISAYDHYFFTTSDDLMPGHFYKFQVTAVNMIGEGVMSQVIGHYA
jgi:hypothetical protein